jgi:hypothetical protein
MAWEGALRTARAAHFAFRPDYLTWEGKHARPAWAVLADEGTRRGALLLQPTAHGLTCGQPWRCGAVVSRGEPMDDPLDLQRDEAEWLFRQATHHARGARLRMYLPFEPPRGVPGYLAGSSVYQDVRASDDGLLRAMASSKRDMVRRAIKRGYSVRPAETLEELRAFNTLSLLARRARGERFREDKRDAPPPGVSWRQWELPWMWLMIAVRDGRIESGAGDSVGTGWSLEARSAASTPEARRDGAFALLCYEEARRARDAGLHWFNHGGDTTFKREMAGKLGRRVPMWCWMSGSALWRLPNEAEAALSRLRRAIAQRRSSAPRRVA